MMRIRYFLILLLPLMVLLSVTLVQGQQEQQLEYVRLGEFGNMWQAPSLEIQLEKPEDIEAPTFKFDKPMFARWYSPRLENGFIWLAVFRAHRYGPYDRLVIDTDGDGSLRDETELKGTVETYINFGPAEIVFGGEGGASVYHLHISWLGGDIQELHFRAGCRYKGEVTIGNRKTTCLLSDNNGNGIFNDVSIDPKQSDRMFFLDREIGEKYVGRYLEVDGVMYHPEVAEDGSYIKFIKVDQVSLGTIRLPETVTAFSVHGENGRFNLQVEKGVLQVPTGKYRINRWIREVKDAKGGMWKLEGMRFDERGDIEVSQTEELVLKVGEVIYPELIVSRQDDLSFSINRILKGSLGEMILMYNNGSYPEPPKIHIKNGDGTYSQTFLLVYG